MSPTTDTITMRTPEEKKSFVKQKFSSISTSYDLINSLVSFKIDWYWRWVTTRELRAFPTGAVLDQRGRQLRRR